MTCRDFIAFFSLLVCKSNLLIFQMCFIRRTIAQSKAAFMLILRGQNQRFETLIQNADPKRRSREYCLCFPREEDDFVSMHCALFEAIVRAQVNRKGVYMTTWLYRRPYAALTHMPEGDPVANPSCPILPVRQN